MFGFFSGDREGAELLDTLRVAISEAQQTSRATQIEISGQIAREMQMLFEAPQPVNRVYRHALLQQMPMKRKQLEADGVQSPRHPLYAKFVMAQIVATLHARADVDRSKLKTLNAAVNELADWYDRLGMSAVKAARAQALPMARGPHYPEAESAH